MKKIKIVGMLLALVLVVAGCSAGVKKDEMAKETMAEKAMEKEVEMKDEAVAEAAATDEMKSDEMKKDDEMKSDEMEKHETMAKEMNDGRMAEKFELMDLDGNVHSLEGYAGEKVYVKFWASWCSICLAGMEELDELAAADNDFKVLTIVTPGKNGEKNVEDFKEWFAGLGYDNITVLLDEGANATLKYGVRGYPTSAYIGSDGVLVKALPGHNGNDAIRTSFEGIH